MRKVATYATAIMLAHGVLLLVHEIAHRDLGIRLPVLKYVYAYVVMVFAPLLGAIMLWTRQRRYGSWIFLLSMLGSLVFGGYHHFVLVSNDHVSHAPEGEWLLTFKVTAVLLAIVEAAGCWIGFRALKKTAGRAPFS